MSDDDKQKRRPLRVFTNHALSYAEHMPMPLELAHAPLLTKIFNLIDDDDDDKSPPKKARICKGVTMDSEEAHLLSTNLLGGQEEGLEHIVYDQDERKATASSADISYSAQIKEQDRRRNVIVYDVNMVNDLLELAAAVANKPDSPEHILASLDTYNNFSHTAEATLNVIRQTATDAWQGKTTSAVEALKRLQPKALGERDEPKPKPRNFRNEIDSEFALLQQNLDGMKSCIDTERETIAHSHDHDFTKECWALASQFLDDAKAHAAEWQRSIRLPPERGQSGSAGRAGGA